MSQASIGLLLAEKNKQPLQMQAGEVVLLSGAVGSGKTYFLKQLAGLHPLPTLAHKNIPQANMLFDVQPSLWMGQLVEEELNHAVYPRLTHEGMRAALDAWRLHDVAIDGRLSILNRIQSLRVHLTAMGLSDRVLWLLDNPTACFPASDGEQLRSDICRWAKKHGCMILVACNRWQDWQNDYTQHWHIQQRETWPSLEQK